METSAFLSAIHATPDRGVFAVSGGGSRAITALLEVPGASRTVLEAVVPYAPQAMNTFLRCVPEGYCAEHTARQLAVAAWQRAIKYENASVSTELFGFGVTASLATDRPHRGEHRAFAAFHSLRKTLSLSLPLEKNARTREEEEVLVAGGALRLLAYALGVAGKEQLPQAGIVQEFAPPESWRRLYSQPQSLVCVKLPEWKEVPAPPVSAILCGSFAPFHHGHARMRDFAGQHLGMEVGLEISVQNADKPPLDYLEIRSRLTHIAQTVSHANESIHVFLTNTPYFRQKTAFFPGATFVVGADTLSRIGDPRYHGGDMSSLLRGFETLAEHGCQFLVLGRVAGNGFCVLDNLDIPPELRKICTGISHEFFREDISSTEIRRKERSKACGE